MRHYATEDIEPGDELFLDYGYDDDDTDDFGDY